MHRIIIVTFCLGALVEPAFCNPGSTSSSSAAGFGRDAIGGCAGRDQSNCTCVVNDLSDDPRILVPGTFRQCAQKPGSGLILFKARGVLKLTRPINVSSNKTIDGRKLEPQDEPVTISGTGTLLRLTQVTNVVVRNLFFRRDTERTAPACAAPDTPTQSRNCGVPILTSGASKIWIDRNSFSACGQICLVMWTAQGGDGRKGDVLGTDQVTISGNIFENSYYGVAIGAANNLAPEKIPKHMRVTLYDNIFRDIFRRSPKASSGAKLHAFNNVITGWGRKNRPCKGKDWGFAASSVGEAELLLENNVFEARPEPGSCKEAVQIGEKRPQEGYVRDTGRVRARGNMVLNGAQLAEQDPSLVFDPNDRANPDLSYPYELREPAGLADRLKGSAGPQDGKP